MFDQTTLSILQMVQLWQLESKEQNNNMYQKAAVSDEMRHS